MPIPGKTQDRDPVGKIRIGEKRGRYAASLDYFRSDNPLFAELAPGDPSEIEIVFYNRDDEAWNSGLEWWVQKDGKNTLACYTKDGGAKPIAKRLPQYIDPENVVVKQGEGRCDIECPFRECRHFASEKKQCRPVGRMTFYLRADSEQRPWRLDTKAWNSIEEIEKALAAHPQQYGWRLSVSFQSKGNKRFPVLTLEPDVQINTEADVALADACVALTKALELGLAREGLADFMTFALPGWRDRPEIINWVRDNGPEKCARLLLERNTR